MAGDWIKMRGNLWDDPRVSRLCDLTEQSEAAVVGGLYWLWASADQHSADGVMEGLTLRSIDRKTGVPGLGKALAAIGWIEESEQGVRINRFDEHNGASAKKRAQTARRVANHKAGNAQAGGEEEAGNAQNDEEGESGNAPSVTPALPREEKRREEVKNPPNPPVGGEQPTKKRERMPRASLKTFIDVCRATGQKPISDYGPLLEYVERVGLPTEYVNLCWDVFKREHLGEGKNVNRLQANWRKHFLNYVEKGYYRLWYARADGSFELSTAGIQAQKFHDQPEVA